MLGLVLRCLFVAFIAGLADAAQAQPRYAPSTEIAYGVDDPVLANRFREANLRADLRRDRRFADLAAELNRLVAQDDTDLHLRRRYLFELADVYGAFLLDLESSIAADLRAAAISPRPTRLAWSTPAANSVLLNDPEYVRRFVTVSDSEIERVSQRRLARNRQLLDGIKPALRVSLLEAELRALATSAATDLARARQGAARATLLQLMSRMLRADYELVVQGAAPGSSVIELLNSGALRIEEVDLDEIDFLRLADYLLRLCKSKGEVLHCEQALDTIYRPYFQLRDPAARWRYNGLINGHVNALAEVNFQRGRFEEMLYYASLNKSRVVLEERLAFVADGRKGNSLADAAQADGIPRTAAGLPSKDWFRRQLKLTDAFVDFYLSGNLVPAGRAAAGEPSGTNRSMAPLSARVLGVESAPQSGEEFADEALYATVVRAGRVVAAQRLTGSELRSQRRRLDHLYEELSMRRGEGQWTADAFFQSIGSALGSASHGVTVSPDKWLIKQPFDLLLARQTTRALNYFVAAPPGEAPVLRVAGFFNPTMDLPGAEQEADAVQKSVPAALVFKREAATVSALQQAVDASIIHLSMHGGFDELDARNSKLYFAGALAEHRGSTSLRVGDPNALYAREMARHPTLSGRELIFAAACQTGLSAVDRRNDAELQGILRPLTANGNRNVILSLWKVDDRATRDFVEAFYARLSQGGSVEVAFHTAQADARRQRPHPYYWAAFYLARSR